MVLNLSIIDNCAEPLTRRDKQLNIKVTIIWLLAELDIWADD